MAAALGTIMALHSAQILCRMLQRNSNTSRWLVDETLEELDAALTLENALGLYATELSSYSAVSTTATAEIDDDDDDDRVRWPLVTQSC